MFNKGHISAAIARNSAKTYANALLYHAGSVRNTCNTLGYGGTTHSGGCVYGVVSLFPV